MGERVATVKEAARGSITLPQEGVLLADGATLMSGARCARRAVYHELIDAIDRRGREGARRAVSIHRTVLRPLLAEFNIAVETGRRRTSSPSNV